MYDTEESYKLLSHFPWYTGTILFLVFTQCIIHSTLTQNYYMKTSTVSLDNS